MSNTPVIGEIEEKDDKQIWIIKPFSKVETNLEPGQTFFCSPVFTTPTPIAYSPCLRWQMKLYPTGSKEDKNYLSLYMVFRSDFEVKARISFYILNDQDEEVHKRLMKCTHIIEESDSWGFPDFLNRNILVQSQQSILRDDTLRISWSITFASTPNQDNNDNSTQIDYFKNIFDNGKFSDVTFVIGRKKLLLHKVILAGLSPVFQAMFEHDMKEKKESVVKITDISYNTMKEFFRYIYLRQVNNIKRNASDLLVAAEKYSVTGLKTLCEQTLTSSLNLDNAIGYLKLAMMYNAMTLKARVTDFIISRLKDFVDREDFKQLEPDYKDELFRAIAQKEVNK